MKGKNTSDYNTSDVRRLQEERDELKRFQQKLEKEEVDIDFGYRKSLYDIQAQGAYWEGNDKVKSMILSRQQELMKKIKWEREEWEEELNRQIVSREKKLKQYRQNKEES